MHYYPRYVGERSAQGVQPLELTITIVHRW